RGGRGAERWDRIAPSTFARPSGESVPGQKLLELLVERSRHVPLIVQPRLSPHPALRPLTAGALPTVRVLTCLDSKGRPQVMAAMMRTSFGENRTVDNLHAGGIGALVDLDSGALSKASNLGSDAHLSWFSNHPDNGARIEGETIPFWSDVKKAAIAPTGGSATVSWLAGISRCSTTGRSSSKEMATPISTSSSASCAWAYASTGLRGCSHIISGNGRSQPKRRRARSQAGLTGWLPPPL
ncbi:MAG TPA: sugar-transfer associated ATP-grasp domain-containing protein, partial [Sphingomicrobium sp.]|nr:sugar-transfer associated ATP-grasp domain-containing protein [Sphingomicrobium sp.]